MAEQLSKIAQPASAQSALMAQLPTLLPMLFGSNTTTQNLSPDMQNILQGLMGNQSGIATSGDFSKEAAIKDSQGLIEQIMKSMKETTLPSIYQQAAGHGGYNASTTKLLANDAFSRALQTAIGAQTDVVTKYSNAQTNTVNSATNAGQALKGGTVQQSTEGQGITLAKVLAGLQLASKGNSAIKALTGTDVVGAGTKAVKSALTPAAAAKAKTATDAVGVTTSTDAITGASSDYNPAIADAVWGGGDMASMYIDGANWGTAADTFNPAMADAIWGADAASSTASATAGPTPGVGFAINAAMGGDVEANDGAYLALDIAMPGVGSAIKWVDDTFLNGQIGSNFDDEVESVENFTKDAGAAIDDYVIQPIAGAASDVGSWLDDNLNPFSGGDGDSVICTELKWQGRLCQADYLLDVAYASAFLPTQLIAGYHVWAIPLVPFLRKHKWASNIAEFLAKKRIAHIKYSLGVGKFTLAGAIIRGIGEPACMLIGKFLKPKDYKSLYQKVGKVGG